MKAKLRSSIADRFVGLLIKHGAKARAKKILGEALGEVRRRIRSAATADQIVEGAVEATKPSIWLSTLRVGGTSIKVPSVVPERQATSIAMPSILEAARSQPGLSMQRRLARALLAAYRGKVDPYRRWLE